MTSPQSFETPETTCPMTLSHSGRSVSPTFSLLQDTNCLQYTLHEPWLVANHFSTVVYLLAPITDGISTYVQELLAIGRRGCMERFKWEDVSNGHRTL